MRPAPRRKTLKSWRRRADGPLLAQRGARAFMSMVLEHRLYHADPHPGNVMALSGDRVGFIDFGMVGQLSERRRNQLLLLLQAIADRQSEGSSTR